MMMILTKTMINAESDHDNLGQHVDPLMLFMDAIRQKYGVQKVEVVSDNAKVTNFVSSSPLHDCCSSSSSSSCSCCQGQPQNQRNEISSVAGIGIPSWARPTTPSDDIVDDNDVVRMTPRTAHKIARWGGDGGESSRKVLPPLKGKVVFPEDEQIKQAASTTFECFV